MLEYAPQRGLPRRPMCGFSCCAVVVPSPAIAAWTPLLARLPLRAWAPALSVPFPLVHLQSQRYALVDCDAWCVRRVYSRQHIAELGVYPEVV